MAILTPASPATPPVKALKSDEIAPQGNAPTEAHTSKAAQLLPRPGLPKTSTTLDAGSSLPGGGASGSLIKKRTFSEEMARLKDLFDTDVKNKSLRALIYGPSGSGKTSSLRTARRPVLVHSFDPGGSKALADLIKSGDFAVDTAFETDNPKAPTAFAAWDKAFTGLRNSKVFEEVGTYVLDSATTWAQCALFEILKIARRPGEVPQQNDWYPQMNLLELAIRQMLVLPCDVILLAHDTADKDEVTGKISRGPLFTGKLTKRIPILFDEVYYAQSKRTGDGTVYYWQTQADATNVAKSRLATVAKQNGNKIDAQEPQDFTALLKKVGYL